MVDGEAKAAMVNIATNVHAKVGRELEMACKRFRKEGENERRRVL